VASTSPHYGARSIELVWKGGHSFVEDSATSVLDDASSKTFDCLFERAWAMNKPPVHSSNERE